MSTETELLRVRLRSDDTHYRSGLIPAASLTALMADCGALLGLRVDGVSGYLASWRSVQVHKPCHVGDYVEVKAALVRKGNRSREYAVSVHRIVETQSEGPTSTGVFLESPELVCDGVYIGVIPAEQAGTRHAEPEPTK